MWAGVCECVAISETYHLHNITGTIWALDSMIFQGKQPKCFHSSHFQSLFSFPLSQPLALPSISILYKWTVCNTFSWRVFSTTGAFVFVRPQLPRRDLSSLGGSATQSCIPWAQDDPTRTLIKTREPLLGATVKTCCLRVWRFTAGTDQSHTLSICTRIFIKWIYIYMEMCASCYEYIWQTAWVRSVKG